MSTALNFLHLLNIVHRDLKPDNVLVWFVPMLRKLNNECGNEFLSVNNPTHIFVVLTDYGSSCLMGSINDGCKGYVGTAGYIAPEILEHGGNANYGPEVYWIFLLLIFFV